MGYKTKVQMIKRAKGPDQFYINFPSACAQMMNFEKGEEVEWIITDSGELILKRFKSREEKTENE